jgi:polysaccharide export outer membrane protein
MNKIVFISIFLSLVFLFSCRSRQELIYLSDASHQEVIQRLPYNETEHLLKAGDILYINIQSMNPDVNKVFNPETNSEGGSSYSSQKFLSPNGAYLYGYEVDDNGFINFPFMGKIQVAGVPQSQVGSVVQKRADEYLNDAIVNVRLLNYKVTVMGEVKSPGIYYNYNNSMTVFEALAMANGNTDYASIKNVVVIRTFPEGNKTYILDLTSKKVYQSEAFYLHPNDYVMVQPDKNKNLQLNSQAFSMVLSSVSFLIAVLGLILR